MFDHLHPCRAGRGHGTIATDAKKHHGFGDPITEGAAAAPTLDSGFFHAHMLRVAHGFLYGRPCWDTREGVPVPSAGSPTRHGLPPSFGDEGGRFTTCSEGAIMANTLTLKGRIAPAKGNTPTPDLVQLHGEIFNATSMAAYYTRRGNTAGAARKLRQGLAALRRLQSLESGVAA